jgi:uncharacterized protein DUF6790
MFLYQDVARLNWRRNYMSINIVLEILRWCGVGVGFYFANVGGQTPQEQFSALCIWIVLCLAGLTAIQSLFFGKKAAQASGYKDSGAYQRQSGLNNMALAITTLLVYLFGWGIHAKLTVMTVLLVFLTLSASNHAWSAIRDKNYKPLNLLRPVLTALLLIFVIPYMVWALP